MGDKLSEYMDFKRSRALELFPVLIRDWDSGTHVPPERRLRPDCAPYGSKAHADWLFLALFGNRFGQSAEVVITAASDAAKDHPDLIDPLTYPREGFEDGERRALERVIPFANKSPERIDEWWNGSMATVRSDYAGDPRNVFLKFADEALEDRAKARNALIDEMSLKFKGIQHKLAQLGLIWYQDVEWPERQAEWAAVRLMKGFAVDVWILRMLYQWDILVPHDPTMEPDRLVVGRMLSDIIIEMCHDEGWDCNKLAQAIWHVGAKTCASMRRKGPERSGAVCNSCPASSHCVRIVPADKRSAGYIGYRNAYPRPATLFYQPVPMLDLE